MLFGSIDPVILIATLIASAAPILLAALGELVVERSGVLNLGVEGMMIIGAAGGFIIGHLTGSSFLGFMGAALAGAVLSLIFAVLTLVLLANQVAVGLALTIFGLGTASLLGQGYGGILPPSASSSAPLDALSGVPVLGPIVFAQHWVVLFSIVMTVALWWGLRATRIGLIIRAVGESHDAAHALGYDVRLVRLLCILFGGAMAGLGGAFISLVRVPQWVDGITAGAGWIALAIVVFASWQPMRALLGAWLFGGITVLQLNLQAAGSSIPTAYLSMAPYVVTILVLVVMSAGRKGKAGGGAPASLGRNFHASR